MDKKRLIESLEQALMAEERAIPIYTKHLNAAVFWAGLPKDHVDKIKETLKQLADESERHRKLVEFMITEIRKVDANHAI